MARRTQKEQAAFEEGWEAAIEWMTGIQSEATHSIAEQEEMAKEMAIHGYSIGQLQRAAAEKTGKSTADYLRDT